MLQREAVIVLANSISLLLGNLLSFKLRERWARDSGEPPAAVPPAA